MRLAPKERFQKSKDNVENLASLVKQDWFHGALQAGLAQMQMDMPGTTNPAQSWDAHAQMQGAKLFIATLLNLTEAIKDKAPVPNKNLNHTV